MLSRDELSKIEQAKIALHNGDLEEVQRLISIVLAEMPGSSDAHNILAAVKQQTGQADDAIKEYQLAIQLDPLNFKPIANLTALLVQLKRFNEALPLAERLRKWDEYSYYCLKGKILTALGRMEEGRDYLVEGVLKATQDAEKYAALLHLANCDARMGRFSESLESAKQAIAITPGRPEAYYWSGIANQELKAYGQALRSFMKLVEVDEPKDAALHARSQLFRDQHMYVLEERDLTEAITINPAEKNYYLDRAVCYFHLRQFELAKKDFALVSGDSEFQIHVHNYQSMMFAEAEDWLNALKEAEQAHLADPSDMVVLSNLKWLRVRAAEAGLLPPA